MHKFLFRNFRWRWDYVIAVCYEPSETGEFYK